MKDVTIGVVLGVVGNLLNAYGYILQVPPHATPSPHAHRCCPLLEAGLELQGGWQAHLEPVAVADWLLGVRGGECGVYRGARV